MALTVETWSVGRTAADANVLSNPTADDRQWPRWTARIPPSAWDFGAVLLGLSDVVLPVSPGWHYDYLLSLLACLALVARRRYPVLVLLAVFPGLLTGYAVVAAQVALFTLAKYRGMNWQTLLGGALVGIGYGVYWPLSDFVALTAGEHVHGLMRSVLVAGSPMVLGMLLRTRRELSDRLAELAAGRQRERQLTEHAVRVEERARLAREMHDVVSHQVSLIAIQAGALQTSAQGGEQQEAAGTIRQLSTRTLNELREMVSVLRTSALDEPGVQPGIDQLQQLVKCSDLRVEADLRLPESVPPQISSAVYRTVQEALTNVRKHAPGSAATVSVATEAGQLLVTVRNTAPVDPARDGDPLPSGGHGLVGLRERAMLLHAHFETGTTNDGGFVVHARFPMRSVRER